MHKIIILVLFTVFLSKVGYNQDTIYFDSKWNVSMDQNYSFYRTITPMKSNYLIEDYFASGQIQMRGVSLSKDSLIKHGVFDYYSGNGMKKRTVSYINDYKHGSYSLYYPNGNLKETGYYKKNLLSGKNIQYFDNGIIKRESRLKHGMYNGKMIYYSEAGIKIGAGNCRNDGWDGKWIKYDFSGERLTEIYYGSDLKIKDYKLKIESNNYVWSLFEKESFNAYDSYLLRCISTTKDKKNSIANAPELRLLAMANDSIFKNYPGESLDKKDYDFNFTDKKLFLNDAFQFEFEDKTGVKAKMIVIKFEKDDMNFILESIIDEDNFERNEIIVRDIIENISGY